MAANGVGEVDEKRMETGVRHVPYDDSLVFSKREVNPELFSMGQERQSAADTRRESLVQRKKRAENREA